MSHQITSLRTSTFINVRHTERSTVCLSQEKTLPSAATVVQRLLWNLSTYETNMLQYIPLPAQCLISVELVTQVCPSS